MPCLHSDTGTGPYTHQPGLLEDNSSRDGAIAIDPHAAAIEARLWQAYLRAGAIGLTDEEAAGMLRVKKITSIIGRRHNLGKSVIWSGRKRQAPSGVRCKVWIAAQFAERSAA
jgi:hypothetical protein